MKSLRRRFLLAVLLACVAVWLGLRWVERSYREEPYSLVEDGLYIGGAVPEPPSRTKAVVNLCGEKDRYTVDAYLWEPILEGGADPDVTWLRRVVEFIAEQRRAGRTIYVHCGV